MFLTGDMQSSSQAGRRITMFYFVKGDINKAVGVCAHNARKHKTRSSTRELTSMQGGPVRAGWQRKILHKR
jgi:hypothetical protein